MRKKIKRLQKRRHAQNIGCFFTVFFSCSDNTRPTFRILVSLRSSVNTIRNRTVTVYRISVILSRMGMIFRADEFEKITAYSSGCKRRPSPTSKKEPVFARVRKNNNALQFISCTWISSKNVKYTCYVMTNGVGVIT